MIFLVLLRKMIFLFPENMILPPGRKMKDDLSQKNTYFFMIFFFRCSEKLVFSKRSHWNMIFLVLSGKVVFFSRKHDIFSLGGGRRVTFLEKYMEIWHFLYTRVQTWRYALLPKKSKMTFSRKNTPKGDLHSRKSPNKRSLYPNPDVVIYCFPAKKTRKLNI